MEIDDKFFIDTDENNYRLNEIKITGSKSKNAGETYTIIQGYYGSLESALKGYVRISMRELPDSVQGVVDKLKEIEQKINNLKGKQIGN